MPAADARDDAFSGGQHFFADVSGRQPSRQRSWPWPRRFPNAWTGSFSLDSGDPTEIIKLFTIGTKETALNLDDLVPYDIKVGLGFSSPSTFDGSVTGATGALWLGQSFGYVHWNDPVQLAFGPGNSGLLQVALSNVAFGSPGASTFYSTFTLLKDAQYSTPEPVLLALLGIGAVVAAMRRRARR